MSTRHHGSRAANARRAAPTDPLIASAATPLTDELWLELVQSGAWAERYPVVPCGALGAGE